ncbi:sensor histidine kinase [Nocardioides marmoraquaticus]
MAQASAAQAPVVRRLLELLPRGGALPEESWRTRHHGIVLLAALHVPVLVAVALWQRPDLTSFAGTAGVALLTLAAWRLPVRRTALASLATAALLLSTAISIHVFDGLIELHFHFFVVIAVVSVYQLWTPYLLAMGFVLAHHAVMGLLMPMHVYNHSAAMAHPVWFALIHGAFVLAESIACLTYWRFTEQALDRERDERARAEASNEALAQAHREISDLMAMVSHDLRAPLTVITGHVELTLDAWDDLDDPDRRDLVRRIGVAGQSLEEMLSGTLTMSALDADGLQPRPVVVRLDELVRGVLGSLADPLAVVDLTGLEPVLAVADRQHVQQVVTNLVSNAAKYGEAPYVISSRSDDETVELLIEDSGTGVPEEFVPRLFDRYSRSEDARRGRQRGTGLGLYIVKTLVEANAGVISYRARSGGGGRFSVRFPRGPRVLAGGTGERRADTPPYASATEQGVTTA